MKTINFHLVLFVITMLSGMAFSEGISNPFMEEIDAYKAGINSESYGTITRTAKQISASGLTNTSLFDNIEKVLLDFHQKQIASSKDESLVNPAIALMRALGSSGNDKYAVTLNMILDESPSRASRNRAKHVLGKIPWYRRRNAIMQDLANHNPDQSLQSTRFINLLTSGDYIFQRYAAEEIYRMGNAEPVVMELMASDLKKGASGEQGKLHVDTMAWYCRVLAKVARTEYHNFIQGLADDKNTHRKIKRHCRKELTRV